MADRLWPTPIDRLAQLLRAQDDCLWGIHRDLIYHPRAADPFRCERFGHSLETPIGVAAGPHTQLAQNIVASWLMGARFVELKTVQTLDQLEVTKPCIVAEDEGYNCEWSQELRLEQSAVEYVKAWVLIHALRRRLGFPAQSPGFVFNTSVGYNLEGIQNPNVQRFLATMVGAGELIERESRLVESVFPEVRDVVVPERISDNVTLSTMHGCPPEEIENIARYLMQEKGLHTTIKLNPTLLGSGEVRSILDETRGFDITVADEAFGHDLKYDAALRLIESLTECAASAGVGFAVKLTNTLEAANTRGFLPLKESMVYMSGRALHVISVSLAARLQKDFGGSLDISFSGGADCFNTPDLVACGLEPVTVCTDLLKPGGYTRLPQYLDELRRRMAEAGACDLADWRRRYGNGSVTDNLQAYASRVRTDPKYRKNALIFGQSIKTRRVLTPFDCVRAPCVETCPADQAVPDYMYHTARGEYEDALEVIRRANPFPTVTGLVCDHLCQFKCTRVAYDHSVQIRDVKRFVAENAPAQTLKPMTPGAQTGARIAVVGGGPSGLACAAFLAREGIAVEIFEAKEHLGGMLQDAIPSFRLTGEDITRDIDTITALGITVHLKTPVDHELFQTLCLDFDAVYVAVGARSDRRLGIPGESEAGVQGALEFLTRVGAGDLESVGPRVAVIGGGNSAVDAARVSYRLAGPGGHISLLYRRTVSEMPADHEEISAIREEGIEIHELVMPVSARRVRGGIALVCQRMELGQPDSSGRPRPVPVAGSEHTRVLDTVLTAIGQVVDVAFAEGQRLTPVGESHGAIMVGGDALRGPASIIMGIGDGRMAARHILQALGTHDKASRPVVTGKTLSIGEHQRRASRRVPPMTVERLPLDRRQTFERVIPALTERQARAEADRCLLCDEICNICVSVCPNRANLFFRAESFEAPVQRVDGEEITVIGIMRVNQTVQTLNVVDWCNECGNCTSFCPTAGSPYRDKPRFCLSESSYEDEDDVCRFGADDVLMRRRSGQQETLTRDGTGWIYERSGLRARLDTGGQVAGVVGAQKPFVSRDALEMLYLATRLRPTPLGRFLAGSGD